MAEFPALPLWTDAFLADTLHLSTEEAGAYLLMLFTAWRRPNCDLPDDDKFLMKICRCDGRKWRHLRPVMEQFHVIENGTWRQVRLQKERKYVGDLSQKQRANINARWSKNKGLGDTTVIPDAYQTDTPTPTPIPKEERKKKEEPPADAGAARAQSQPIVIPKPDLPDWIDPAAWAGYVEMRKRKRAPMTARAQVLVIRELTKLRSQGHDPTAVLDQSTQRTWTDIYEIKTGDKNGNRLRKPTAHDAFLAAAEGIIRDELAAAAYEEGADWPHALDAGPKLLSS